MFARGDAFKSSQQNKFLIVLHVVCHSLIAFTITYTNVCLEGGTPWLISLQKEKAYL